MGKITRFEDLRCWQEARQLVKNIYQLTAFGKLSKDYGLKDQLQRASVSIITNIAEGFSRYHKKEFIRFLNISQSSASEVKSLLYIICDLEYVEKSKIDHLQSRCEKTKALTLSLLKHVSSQLPKNTVNEPMPQYTAKPFYISDEFEKS